jgi:hypothetical protein
MQQQLNGAAFLYEAAAATCGVACWLKADGLVLQLLHAVGCKPNCQAASVLQQSDVLHPGTTSSQI